MFTSDEKINLRLAKKFAENVAEVLLEAAPLLLYHLEIALNGKDN